MLRVSTGPPGSLVPADAADRTTQGILAALFSPLVQVTPDGTLEPLVASALPTSSDAVTWTIPVAPGWTFHNGEPVTGASFVNAWNFTASSDTYHGGDFTMTTIAGFEEVAYQTANTLSGLTLLDPMTIQVRLSAPDSMFPVALAEVPFAPMSQSCLADPYVCEASPIGNGPFEIAAPWTTPYDPLLLERFDNWQGGAPAVADRIEMHFSTYGPDMFAGVQAGRVDLASLSDGVPDATGSTVLTEMAGSSLHLLSFADDDDRFDDPRIRTAIGMAIDRDALAKVAGGVPAHGVSPSTVIGHQEDACGRACEFDPAAAKALLTEAGGVAGPVTLTYSGDYGGEASYRLLGDQLGTSLGIEIVLHNRDGDPGQPFGDHAADEGLFESSAYAETPTAAGMLSRWRSDVDQPLTSGNGLGYRNDAVDDLLGRASSAVILDDASALLQEAERAVLADLPSVPMWFSATEFVSSDRLSGLVATPYGAPRWELLDPR